jgi:G3E family GTPase
MTDPRYRGNSSAAADAAAEEAEAVTGRALDAHQALSGMIFAALKMRGRQRRAGEDTVPLTIIGGFLGSGKTTLLSHLLTSSHGRRLVVLVNDFGAINIDASLVASQTDDMINLKNGCACCAVSADLTNALIEIVEREELPDAVVLESSGIADPHGIAQIALSNPSVQLDGSLTVVDAETMQERVEDPLTRRLFRNQISSADLIVLSKTDLVDASARNRAREWFASHYPGKRVIEAVKGDVPVELLLGIETRGDVRTETSESEDHAHDFESLSFTSESPFDKERLLSFLDSMPESVLRAKGVLFFASEPAQRTIYQRVGSRWSITPGDPWNDEPPHSSLVFIGPTGFLDRATFEKGLGASVIDPKKSC